jgi:hypothetical protein
MGAGNGRKNASFGVKMKVAEKTTGGELDLSSMTREQLAELVEMQKTKLHILQSEVAGLRTTGEVLKETGRDAANALGKGVALATIGQGNEMARDRLLGLLGDAAPAVLRTEVGRDALLMMSPALMLLAVDLGPSMGLPVPERGRELVRGAAIVGLEHAGMKNTRTAMKALWEVLEPLFTIYMLGGRQLQTAGALPQDLARDLCEADERVPAYGQVS